MSHGRGARIGDSALGVEHTLRADGTDIPAAVADLTDGSHVAVDAEGSEQTCADAILNLRRRGCHIQVGLLPPVGEPRVPMARVIDWELDVLGSQGMAPVDYPGKPTPNIGIGPHASLRLIRTLLP